MDSFEFSRPASSSSTQQTHNTVAEAIRQSPRSLVTTWTHEADAEADPEIGLRSSRSTQPSGDDAYQRYFDSLSIEAQRMSVLCDLKVRRLMSLRGRIMSEIRAIANNPEDSCDRIAEFAQRTVDPFAPHSRP